MRMTFLFLAVGVCVGGGFAPAQGFVVVPSKAGVASPLATYHGISPQVSIFWGAPPPVPAGSRVLYAYDVGDVAVGAGTLQALQLRPDRGFFTGANTYAMTIDLSVGPNASTAMSATFDANHGSDRTRVFSGSVNVRGGIGSTTWPAPWLPPIAFTQPFPYQAAAGASLIVDFVTTASQQPFPNQMEGYAIEGGFAQHEFWDLDCLSSAGPISGNWAWNPRDFVPGGTFVMANDAPPNTPSFANNAVVFTLDGVGSQFMGFTTPFRLGLLGVPSPPTCEWGIGGPMLGSCIATYTGSSVVVAGIPVPSIPSIAGRQFRTQPVGLDVIQGMPTLVPLVALRWTVGSGAKVPASQVSQLFDPGFGIPATGFVVESDAAAIRFSL